MSLIPLFVGFVIGAGLFSVLLLFAVRSARHSVSQELDNKDLELVELRQEAAADRETNRRLRHEMHGLRTAKGVGNLAPQGSSHEDQADDEDEGHEQDEGHLQDEDHEDVSTNSVDGSHHLQIELEEAKTQIADQDAKLKQYRQALTEIRMSLEARDPLTKLVQITDEIPATPEADTASDVA